MTARDRAHRFCERFGLSVPILQSPMAVASPTALAAAVATAGGLGGIGVSRENPEGIRARVAAFRAASNGSFQLSLPLRGPSPPIDPQVEAQVRDILGNLGGHEVPDAAPCPFDWDAQFEAALDMSPPIMSCIFGVFPDAVATRLRERDIPWFAAATTVAEARAVEAAGAAAVVTQGAEAGGIRSAHDGRYAEQQLIGLFALLPQVADAVSIPVIAAGGIMDGRGVAAALTLGASAVQMGTAFLRTPESAISQAWIDAMDTARAEDIVLSRANTGNLGRAKRSALTDAFAGGAPVAAYPRQWDLTTAARAVATHPDGLAQAACGQGVSLGRSMPAADLVRQIWASTLTLLP